MVFKKWRQRRASIRELRANPDDTYKEYLKLCALDKKLRANQPPQYGEVLRGSGESISTNDSRSRGSTIGTQMSNSRPATLLEEDGLDRERTHLGAED
jgi:hypothetical protein